MRFLCAKLAVAAIFATLIWSCTKTDEIVPGGGGEGDLVAATIQAGIGGQSKSRAHDATWDENDQIGLAMLIDGGKDIINDVYNYHYITRTGVDIFEPHSSEMMIYFPANGNPVNFRAYYPYYAGLDQYMRIPVDVSSQTNLPQIDLMSAEHLAGYTKADPVVLLHFYHRLTKVIFNLSGDDPEVFGDLSKCTVTISGMETTGIYDLLDEELDVDESSEEDITITRHDAPANQRYGIVLPRPAGEGVKFTFTFENGAEYTADMDSDLTLLAGYQYTFNIRFRETSVEISADIENWYDGPAQYYDALQAHVDAGDSENVDPGTVMDVFLSGSENGDYGPLATFTYGEDGKWTSEKDVYWESIEYNPAWLRASIVMEDPLDPTQTGDWLTSRPISVARNTAAHFELKRAVSKVFVELKGTEFSADELASATVTLPDYKVGGYLGNGEFIEGSERGDIRMVKDEETGAWVALMQPQPVSAEARVVNIDINGRTYYVEAEAGGIDFQAGIATRIVITLSKNDLSVSVSVVDWKPGKTYTFDTIRLGAVAGESHNVKEGDVIELYRLDGSSYAYQTSYTYQSGTWNGAEDIYWEDIPDGTSYFIARMDIADAVGTNQLPDVMLSPPTRAYHFEAIDFELYHAAAKASVVLVSDTFTDAQLAGATITLPGYKTGAAFDGAVLTGTTGTGNIVTDRSDPTTATALFHEQTIPAGQTVVAVTIGGTTYNAAYDENIVFEPGVATVLVVHLNKNGIAISVRVNDWDDDEYELFVLPLNIIAGENEGVQNSDVLDVYTGNGSARTLLGEYTFDGTEWNGPTIYWEDLDDPTTFYASILRQEAYNNTMPDDYLLATPVTTGYGTAVNFEMSHAVAQVAVQLKSVDGSFSKEELAAMNVTLPGYATGGTYDNGIFVPGGGAGTVELEKIDGSGLGFVQPQTKEAGQTVALVATADRTYPVTYASNVLFRAGYTTVLIIDIRKTGIALSVKIVDWIEGQNIQLIADTITIEGGLAGTDDYFDQKTIYVYNVTDSERYPYTYIDNVWNGEKLYWDSYVSTGLTMGAVYFNSFPVAPAGSASFPVSIPVDQSAGWEQYDLLMDYISLAPNDYRYFNFNFKHVFSRVKVTVRSDEFTDDQLVNSVVKLLGFEMTGTATLSSSSVTANAAKTDVTPYTLVNGRQYEAIVMPQTIQPNTKVVSIELPMYPGEVFDGAYTNPLEFRAGYITEITVNLVRGRIYLSAQLEEWKENGGGTIIIQ